MSTELKYGPNTAEVQAMLDRLRQATPEELWALRKAWEAARDPIMDAARDAIWDSSGNEVWDASWDASWDSIWDAAGDKAREAAWLAVTEEVLPAVWSVQAVAVRDVLAAKHFVALTNPWRSVFGPTWEKKK